MGRRVDPSCTAAHHAAPDPSESRPEELCHLASCRGAIPGAHDRHARLERPQRPASHEEAGGRIEEVQDFARVFLVVRDHQAGAGSLEPPEDFGAVQLPRMLAVGVAPGAAGSDGGQAGPSRTPMLSQLQEAPRSERA